jgi:hypothetical protein
MMIDKELRECFGEELIFASDQDRAFDWLTSLRRRKIGWKQARAQIVEHLRSRNAQDSYPKAGRPCKTDVDKMVGGLAGSSQTSAAFSSRD